MAAEADAEYYKYVKYKTKYLDLKEHFQGMRGGDVYGGNVYGGGSLSERVFDEDNFTNESDKFLVNNIKNLMFQYGEKLRNFKDHLKKNGENLPETSALLDKVQSIVNSFDHDPTKMSFNQQIKKQYITNATTQEMMNKSERCMNDLIALSQSYITFLEGINQKVFSSIEEVNKYGAYHQSFISTYKELVNCLQDINISFKQLSGIESMDTTMIKLTNAKTEIDNFNPINLQITKQVQDKPHKKSACVVQ